VLLRAQQVEGAIELGVLEGVKGIGVRHPEELANAPAERHHDLADRALPRIVGG
jgi:hypothetical protein